MFTRVRGNTIQFAMPLQGKTFFAGGIAVYDFVPAETDEITIIMQDRKAYTYTPTVQSNMLLWTDDGNLDVGMYSVEVIVNRADGTQLRCVRINQVNIVETNAESELDFPMVSASSDETTPEEVDASEFEETVSEADSGTAETTEQAATGNETPLRSVVSSDFEETGPGYESDVPLTDGPNEHFYPRDVLSAGVFIFAGDGTLGIREIAEGVFSDRIIDVENGLIHDYTSKIALSARELKSDYEEQIYDAKGELTEAYQSEILQTARQITLSVEEYRTESNGHYSELSSELTIQSDRIETKVSQEDYDEDNILIQERFSDVIQNAELLRATVVDNKREADGSFRNLQSQLTMTAAQIAAKVSSLEYNADKQETNEKFSQLIMQANMISAQVVANKTSTDGLIQGLERRLIMDEAGISTLVADLNILGGQVTVAHSEIIQLANSIGLKVNQSDYNVDKQSILQRLASLTVDVDGVHTEVSRVETKVDEHTVTLAEYALDIQDLQNQIDGAIDTWFYDYPPVHVDGHGAPDSTVPLITDSLGNPVHPYYDWYNDETQEEPEKVRDMHLGDIFYDNASGYAYRFEGSGEPGSRVYSWVVIQDSAVITALQNAAKAQDTADHKRRVFVTTPYGPYDVGDLWVQGHKNTNDGAIFRCQTARETTDYFAAGDWIPAADYESVKISRANFDVFADAIVGTVAEYDSEGNITSEFASLISQTIDNISFSVSKVGSALLPTGIDIEHGKIVITASNFFIRDNDAQHTEYAFAITHDPITGVPKIAASNLEINNLVLGGNTGASDAWQVWAGMSGEYDSTADGGGVAAWFGGTSKDAFTISGWAQMTDAQKASAWNTYRYARALFRMDGSGYLANGEISWSGSGSVVIHGATMYDSSNNQISVEDLIELKSWFTKVPYTDGQGNTRYALKLVTGTTAGSIGGFVTEGFGVFAASANFTPGGGGGGGIDLNLMWASLQNTTPDTHATDKFHKNHLPAIVAADGISAGYTLDSGNLATHLNIGISAIDMSKITGLSTALAGKADASALSAYALTSSLGTFAYRSSLAFSELSSHPTTVDGYGITDTFKIRSLNSVDVTLSNKVFSAGVTNKGDFSAQTECPTNFGAYLSIQYSATKNQGFQIYGDTSGGNGGIYYRYREAGDSNVNYNSWVRVLDANNFSSIIGSTTYAPYNSAGYLPLSGGTMSGALTISRNASTNLLTLINNYDARWVSGLSFETPNLSTGHSATVGFGKTGSTNNLGVLEFYYSSSHSNDNYVGLGFYSNNALFKLYPNGKVSASSLTLAGAISGATSIDSLLYFDTTNSRVGIDDPSPIAKLTVNGGVMCNNIFFRNRSYNTGVYFQQNQDELVLYGCTYSPFAWTKSFGCIKYTTGYFGIGNTNPQYNLDVSGTFRATGETHFGNQVFIDLDTDAGLSKTSGSLIIGSQSGNTIGIDGNEIVARNSGSNPSTLHLNYDSGNIVCCFTGNGNMSIGNIAASHRLSVGGVIYSSTGVLSPGYGNFAASYSSSDQRLKDDIETIKPEYAIEKLMALRPSEWVWNEKSSMAGRKGAGLVAQHVEPVLPWNIEKNGEYLSLCYDMFHPYEIGSIQFLKGETDMLKDEVAELRNRVETLESENKILKERIYA